jgi:hypothetical protein
MKHKQLASLKINLGMLNRSELVQLIWKLAKDEFETFDDVLEIAKETDTQLRQRLSHILHWFEYLAK